jgi:hypothetical protein
VAGAVRAREAALPGAELSRARRLDSFTGPAGTSRQRTELTARQREILHALNVAQPPLFLDLQAETSSVAVGARTHGGAPGPGARLRMWLRRLQPATRAVLAATRRSSRTSPSVAKASVSAAL